MVSSICTFADKIYFSPKFLYPATNLYAVSKYLLVSSSPILSKKSLSEVIINSQAIFVVFIILPCKLFSFCNILIALVYVVLHFFIE